MTIGERIEERRKALRIPSQSELARRAEMGQSTLNGLIRNSYRWSPHLPRLARELQTTVEYLVGDTDDPDEGAPPPPAAPTSQFLMMPVAIPSENALARMFEGLLELVDQFAPKDELARELAQLLPTGLSQLQGRLTETAIARRSAAAEPPVPATADREPPQ
jgi:transcriptional regulator with XRE-family HTH domain